MESIEIITVVKVESPKVIVHVESGGESDGIGWDGRSGRGEFTLETDWVDLRFPDSVHGSDLVSEEVISGSSVKQSSHR